MRLVARPREPTGFDGALDLGVHLGDQVRLALDTIDHGARRQEHDAAQPGLVSRRELSFFGVAGQRPHRLALFEELSDEVFSDIAGGASDEDHEGFSLC
ncbi:MAG TPA: hypothetical protein PLC98_11320 [Anaerolineales bacterium]|nr:hypothetical protein [Anaerolineales bacterium]